MAFSPPEYCRLFAQKKAYQGGGVTGTPGPLPAPPSYALVMDAPSQNESQAKYFGRLQKKIKQFSRRKLACEVSYKGQTVWRESINKRSMNEEVVFFLLQMWPLTLE